MATQEPPDNNSRTRVVDSGAPLALAAGTLLGRYRIDGVLGQGGFGITYRATDTALNRVVAIKEYLPSDVAIRIDGSTVIPRSRTDANDYDWGLKRFLDEAKTLAQHEAVPNVVRVYDFVEANGTAYMVMALVEGDNLSTILRQRGTLNEQELRAIVLPLLDGLEQLHEAGLIHRDIKPANIILRSGRGPTLIDFGAAREGLGRKSRSVTSILTPGYAPFEQYGSAGDQGPWTDIYALAATLYHGVNGKAPPDSVDRIRRDPMVPAVQVGAGRYSETFLAAIDAGLKVDERERPQNAAQWRELFGGVSVATIAPSTIQPVNVAPPAPPPVSIPSRQPAPSLRPSIEQAPPPSILSAPPAARTGARNKVMIVAGVAVLLIGGGVAAALSVGGSSPPATPQPGKVDTANIQIAAAEKERVEADKRRTAELEKRLADEETRRKAAEESQAKVLAEADRRRQAEEEARKKAEAEAENKRRIDEENRKRAEADAESRKRIEEETRKKVEAEFKAKAEEDARKRKTEDEAKSKVEEARLKAEEAKRKVEEARQKIEDARAKVEQRTGANPQVAAAPPPAAAAPPDPAAYVAQHWPVMRSKVEAALRQRGVFIDPVSGIGMKFDVIYNYRVQQVTPNQIVLSVTFRNVRAIPGSGHMTGSSADATETATFQNRPPDFPLVSVQGATSSPQREQQVAAAPATFGEDTVRQNWSVLKANAHAFLTKKNIINHPQSGYPFRFHSVMDNYKITSITPTTITLDMTLSVLNVSNSPSYIAGVAVFRNEAPGFAVIRID